MMYVGIDQHARHLTICGRDEQGDMVLRRQVSTRGSELDSFLDALQEQSEGQGGYVAVVEVCGFNGWLIQRLREHGCVRVCLITPPPRLRQKTDRRDAGKLSELLWSNRNRIAGGDRLVSISEVYQPTAEEEHDRRLTHMRWRLGREQTRVKNQIKGILRRHNLQHACPTKGVFTRAGLEWLTTVALTEMDRVELDMRLEEYRLHARHIRQVDARITERARRDSRVPLLRTVAKIGEYTALALSSHIGPIGRFRHARSLANFFGVTPGCRSSGQTERMGSITKAGHPLVRFLLGQMVLNALRSDPGLRRWYQRIKRRRGCKIARVAVMRRLCEAIWHMLSKQVRYRCVGQTGVPERSGSSPRAA